MVEVCAWDGKPIEGTPILQVQARIEDNPGPREIHRAYLCSEHATLIRKLVMFQPAMPQTVKDTNGPVCSPVGCVNCDG